VLSGHKSIPTWKLVPNLPGTTPRHLHRGVGVAHPQSEGQSNLFKRDLFKRNLLMRVMVDHSGTFPFASKTVSPQKSRWLRVLFL
jgi:hypothetical protein